MTREASDEASREARLLICDCDGVLIDSETVAASMLVRELSARWPDSDIEPVVLPLLGLRIERVLEESAVALGKTLTAADIDAIRGSVEAAARQAPVVDGVEAALSQIALTKACASNSYTGYVEAVLARTGLGRFFGTRLFCADRVARPKPAPDVYVAAADTLGVAREACLVVEDSVAGVAAANAAGMPVLGFVGGGHATRAQMEALITAGAKHVFDDMRELPALVDRWIEARLESARLATNIKGDESWQA
ncbi:HAD superfamily hydrolase (TIGR01509 family) [Trinickia symbiotica]|uniref:HAD family hydrolase n=1 Tax=Trinickia symbiotica TaxID=863227 RepID=A0A2N7WTF9_9BURK|nr:HAD-IA family hydrolase [Trinickia symbiotica]PMS32768.1 HAD family hydrolase [Trinickia symbiotica]PPK42138.1 HAD superfamily hydrolase (TIGR01509 family) [Trinickia symbiotica]